jgi:hypothetical protein
MQRGRAVAPGRVDVDAGLPEQRPHGGCVAVHGRVGQARVAIGSGSEARGEEQQREGGNAKQGRSWSRHLEAP